MNTASRLILQLAVAAAAGYAGAACHLHAPVLRTPALAAGSIVQTATTPGTSLHLASPAQGTARVLATSLRGAAARGGASVLTVYCAAARPAAPGALAIASGVVVEREGLVVTTSEVAAQAGDLFVGLVDGSHRPARLLAVDREAALALLKVDGLALEPIEIAGPDAAAVGDTVIAVGDALGVGLTVTQGIVSAIRPAQLEGAAPVEFIQTDAAVHSGNFGGPLLDAAGRLVGITVGKFDGGEGDGLAFAVPAERVARVVAQLRRGPVSHQQRPPPAAESHGFTEIAYRDRPHMPGR